MCSLMQLGRPLASPVTRLTRFIWFELRWPAVLHLTSYGFALGGSGYW
jgi:hypothetical protein